MEFPRTIRILLVEDNPSHAVFFKASLGKAFKQAHEVEIAECLVECFAKLEASHYDLVVLDLGLPETQGLTTVTSFFKEWGGEYPVIVLTASAGNGIGEKALRLGAMDFLPKGEIGADQLARAVRYGLERWRQRLELDEAQRNLKSFAHVAAHDLKSPVKSIALYADMLRKNPKNGSEDTEGREYLGYISEFADQALSLVDSLLQFSLLGEKSVSLETVDVRQVTSKAISSLKAVAVENQAKIEVDELPEANADEGLLAHVLQNLIANAIKYRSDDPPVVKVTGVHRGDQVEISVQDNGRGIDERFFGRIFEPFKRLAGRFGEEGVGLGLTICQRVVDAHHGRIWVESELGVGSVFKFTLPASSGEESRELKEAEAASVRSNA
ncbi:sensor histidine kinase [Pelagicoccus albus]|uniref:histidine kinase n=1 Tax=Pelagicoccus albus TaxID=415222 RepID=A0A7X1B2W1_9BACT|nr:hybrid sensor histidine kinase/response regulator [Pelagicoccus albus]MBC2604502.1 response regulator [Pelagicoccus albus]